MFKLLLNSKLIDELLKVRQDELQLITKKVVNSFAYTSIASTKATTSLNLWAFKETMKINNRQTKENKYK